MEYTQRDYADSMWEVQTTVANKGEVMAAKKEVVLGYVVIRDYNESIIDSAGNEAHFTYDASEAAALKNVLEDFNGRPEDYSDEEFTIYKLVKVSHYEVVAPKSFVIKKIA